MIDRTELSENSEQQNKLQGHVENFIKKTSTVGSSGGKSYLNRIIFE